MRSNPHDLLPEYDFSGAVRGKYYERYREGTNVVLLDPDIAAVFRDSAAAIADQAAAGEPRNSWCTSRWWSGCGSRLKQQR